MGIVPDYSDLIAEIGALEQMLADVERILQRSDNERRLELIGLRRLISTQIPRVRDAGARACLPIDGTTLATEYRSRFSAMLNALALHQANWPAIKVNEDMEGYLRSAATVVSMVRAFTTWTRRAFAALPEKVTRT
ncbi:MAG: hypothetical protein JWR80_7580 [Bradyrhizobium sp.]|nr:hypothetical protein [Bradyrhizobium sp.]